MIFYYAYFKAKVPGTQTLVRDILSTLLTLEKRQDPKRLTIEIPHLEAHLLYNLDKKRIVMLGSWDPAAETKRLISALMNLLFLVKVKVGILIFILI